MQKFLLSTNVTHYLAFINYLFITGNILSKTQNIILLINWLFVAEFS